VKKKRCENIQLSKHPRFTRFFSIPFIRIKYRVLGYLINNGKKIICKKGIEKNLVNLVFLIKNYKNKKC